MDDWEKLAQRNALLVHGLDWNERRAGIFEPALTDELAVATTLGLVLNCLSSGLYMVSQLPYLDVNATKSVQCISKQCVDLTGVSSEDAIRHDNACYYLPSVVTSWMSMHVSCGLFWC